MILEGWTLQRGDEVSVKITKGASPKWQGFQYQDEGVLFVTSENVRDGFLDVRSPKFLPVAFGMKQKGSRLQFGDILINIVGASIGRSCRFDLSGVDANINQAVCVLRPVSEDIGRYLIQYLQSRQGVTALVGQQSDSARPNLTLEDIRSLPIPLPPPEERVRLVGILEVWDRAIETVEALIANARAQKQALMQQLLSGKRRLPGFSKLWEWVAFADVFDRVKTKNAQGNTNVLTISAQHGLISQVEYFNKSVASDDVRGYMLLQRGDFAYNKSYSDGYPMGAIKPLDRYDSGIVSSLYICFRLTKHGFEHDFFRHYFEAGLFNREIAAIAQEGARNHGLLNVSVIEFFETSLHIPKPDEQTAIAKVINTAEAEEKAYQAQLTALRLEKVALMQQLLTGKRRVKISESEAAWPGMPDAKTGTRRPKMRVRTAT